MTGFIQSMSSDELFNLFFLLVGIGATAYGVLYAYVAFKSKNWPSTDGIVTMSAVEVSYTYHKGWRRKREEHAFFYDYEINGELYTGRTIAFGLKTRSARRRFETYPPNKTLKVFYDPENPSRSCLEPGKLIGSALSAILGLAVLVYIFVKNT